MTTAYSKAGDLRVVVSVDTGCFYVEFFGTDGTWTSYQVASEATGNMLRSLLLGEVERPGGSRVPWCGLDRTETPEALPVAESRDVALWSGMVDAIDHSRSRFRVDGYEFQLPDSAAAKQVELGRRVRLVIEDVG